MNARAISVAWLSRFFALGLLAISAVPEAWAGCLIPYWSQTYSTSRTADFVITPDLDGDGKPDIAGNTLTEIFVLRNDGTGHFAAPVVVYTGTIHGSIVAEDFDGDGKMDLAFAGASSLFVLPGHGDGTFGSVIESPITIAPARLSSGHFDAGSSIDLVTYDPAAKLIVVYSNDGTGHFVELSRTPIAANARAMVAADFDADGNLDVIVGYTAQLSYDAFYGHGDGTFESPQTIWGVYEPNLLRAEKIDGTGLTDLIVGRYYDLAIIRNLGGRNFGDPLRYSSPGTTEALTTADVTGDSVPDIVGSTSCDFFSDTSTGIGTISYIRDNIHDCYYETNTGALAAADFDGDGRPDLVLSLADTSDLSKYLLKVYRNVCGDSTFTATAESPTISTGQAATLNITLLPPVDQYAYFPTTGQFSIKEGSQVLTTATFQSGRGTMIVTGLPLGDHTLTASYDGDPEYVATTSAPVVIHVTTATTTTSLSIDPAAPVYNQPVQIHATVTSSTGDTPGGTIRFVIDGQSGFYTPGTAPQATTYGPTATGSHIVVVNYIGDATHPPSSVTQTYVVSKQKPQIALGLASTAANAAFRTSIYLSSAYSGSSNPTGSVTLSEGTTSLGTQSLASYPLVYFDFPPLAPGRHEFRVVYTGDANYQPVDTFLTIIAFATTSASVDARGNANNISVVWYPTSFVGISRKTASQPWSSATRMCCWSSPFTDSNGVQPETVYLYRAESYDGSLLSNVDVGMRISFTDDPLLPGTVIGSLHLQEIVHAVNLLRTAAHLSAISSDPFIAGAPVTAAGINLLRTAINEARVTLGAYPFAFTGTVTSGAAVRAADIRELREAVR